MDCSISKHQPYQLSESLKPEDPFKCITGGFAMMNGGFSASGS
jgi:hypothetical protein